MSSEEDFQGTSDDSNASRRSFLLTYTQADISRIPTCKKFAEVVMEGFEHVKSSRTVKEWACCQEKHANGGTHYHLCVNLSGSRRWNPVKNYIYNKHNISVNFATSNCGYVAAYRYVCKDKAIEEVLHSTNHTDLKSINTPKTKKAMKTNSDNRKRKSINFNAEKETVPQKEFKPKRLSKHHVAEFILRNKIKTEEELYAISKQRKEDGEPDIYNFIVNCNPKSVSDLVAVTWKIENAQEVVTRKQTDRFQIITRIKKSGVCSDECAGKWFRCAKEILQNNQVNMYYFARAIRQALKVGRQKNTNVLITGPTNCGKSFLFDPLELAFKAFVNPANGKYAWISLDECEVAYLNDFRWSPEMITWSDFLLLLEGQTVHLPRPKNMYATDMRIDRSNTIPFFATSKSEIEYIGKFNQRDERENDMMSSRWLTIRFSKQIENPQHVEPCTKCFAKLVMLGCDEEPW